MRARGALAVLAAGVCVAPASSRPGAHRGVVMFSAGPADDGTSTFTPIACAGGGGRGAHVRGGAPCLPARAGAGSLAIADGTTARARRVARVPVCTDPYMDETRPPRMPGLAVAGAAAALAVWPAGADAGLRAADSSRSRAPTPVEERRFAPELVTQVFADDLDGDGVVDLAFAVRDRDQHMPVEHADVVIVDGADPTRTTRLHASFPAAVRAEILGSSDVDGDGRRELIVRYPAVNDFGLAVWEVGSAAPRYAFDCGNV